MYNIAVDAIAMQGASATRVMVLHQQTQGHNDSASSRNEFSCGCKSVDRASIMTDLYYDLC